MDQIGENQIDEENNIEDQQVEDNEAIGDVFDTLTEEQKGAVYTIIEQILKENGVSLDDIEE